MTEANVSPGAAATATEANNKADRLRDTSYRTRQFPAIPVRIKSRSGLAAELQSDGGEWLLYLWGRDPDWGELRGCFANPTDAIHALLSLARSTAEGV